MIRVCLLSTFTMRCVIANNVSIRLPAQKNIFDQLERARSDLVFSETANCMLCRINAIKCSLTLLYLCVEMTAFSAPDHFKSNLNCIPYLTLRRVLKCHYDENCIFSIEAIFKRKQVACMRRKILFTIFKYLFLFQRYSSF